MGHVGYKWAIKNQNKSYIYNTIQTFESSMYEFSSSFIWLLKKRKDDLTVEEVWYTNFLHTDLTISIKGHNSGTPMPNLTKQMSWTLILLFIKFMYINFHLEILTTVVLVLDWKKQCEDNLSPDSRCRSGTWT